MDADADTEEPESLEVTTLLLASAGSVFVSWLLEDRAAALNAKSPVCVFILGILPPCSGDWKSPGGLGVVCSAGGSPVAGWPGVPPASVVAGFGVVFGG